MTMRAVLSGRRDTKRRGTRRASALDALARTASPFRGVRVDREKKPGATRPDEPRSSVGERPAPNAP